ncbi:MAG: bifunctional 3-deoxy-7-phosphoheptulonate synthase/chorismate mutase type II [Nitrospiraceae bacterium]|nr:MAG: bifunctional 3-deoxy-7-phosphoheptulonate synthase/chorismate mutase type II [Nitrospiraceae bacterium]
MELSVLPLEQWGMPRKAPFLCAGPCSAESEEQLLETARGIERGGISLLRAGLWKPRTQPGTFEGVGVRGLEWLTRAGQAIDVPVATEVATPQHVEACLKHNIHVLWIGARTTTNPFAVQALADALLGTDIPVFVKNPISPDVELWIGAIHRLWNAGLRRIGAIHRGFSTSKKILYRNAPNWKIPIELKRRIPAIPLLCDPSHICGRGDLIFSIAQEALDLLYDGLMVEVHRSPAEALSDSGQQLTPGEFHELVRRLTIKRESADSSEYQTRIRELRHEIDTIDEHMLQLLSKRMEIAAKMGDLKRKNNISVLQPHRWEEIIESRRAMGEELGLSGEFLFQLLQIIHEEAIEQQETKVRKTGSGEERKEKTDEGQ